MSKKEQEPESHAGKQKKTHFVPDGKGGWQEEKHTKESKEAEDGKEQG